MKDSVFALRSVLDSSPLSALFCCGTLVLGTSLVELAFPSPDSFSGASRWCPVDASSVSAQQEYKQKTQCLLNANVKQIYPFCLVFWL